MQANRARKNFGNQNKTFNVYKNKRAKARKMKYLKWCNKELENTELNNQPIQKVQHPTNMSARSDQQKMD